MQDVTRAHYREQLSRDGFIIVPEQAMGLSREFRDGVLTRHFGSLQRDQEQVHTDRERLRSVFRYRVHGDEVELHEQACVDIVNRNHQGVRVYPRVQLGWDRSVTAFVRETLCLLPPAARPDASTFSINLFRTRNAVTMGPHQDLERYIVVHVLRKVGAGAHTILFDAEQRERVIATVCLQEGDTMIFEDRRFFHHVTPLTSTGEPCVRDALVCTVDHPETYGVAS